MKIEDLDHIVLRLREKPFRTVVLVIVLVTVVIGGRWVLTYVGKKAEAAADTPPSSQQTTKPDSAPRKPESATEWENAIAGARVFAHPESDGAWASRTFSILREPGASLRLGPCPGPECFQFQLGPSHLEQGALWQQFSLRGGGFGVERGVSPDGAWFQRMNSHISFRGGGSSFSLLPDDTIELALELRPDAGFHVSSKQADVSIAVLDTSVDSLRIRVALFPSTWKTIPAALGADHPETGSRESGQAKVAVGPEDVDSFATISATMPPDGNDLALRPSADPGHAASGRTPGANLQPQPEPLGEVEPCKSSVVVWKSQEFKGEKLIVKSSLEGLRSFGFNDTAESVCIPDGWVVRFFEAVNFKGEFIELRGPVRVPALGPLGWEDKISSIQVLRQGSGQ